MSSSAEAPVNRDVAGRSPQTAYTYSVLRVEPDPVRGEFVNVGVAMVDDTGAYSKVVYNYRIQSRLSGLGAGRLVGPILDELGAMVVAYDVAGPQLRPELRTQPPVTKGLLEEWSTERGGIVRMSSPRIVLAEDPDAAFERVYRRFVRGPAQEAGARRLTPEAERSQLRDGFVRALSHLKNFDQTRIRVGSAVQGRRAHHWVDLAVVGRGFPTAFAHAIPLRATDDRPVFMHRGLVLEAAGDMPENAPRLALYDDPPTTRRELLDETQTLLRDAGVIMVSKTGFGSAVLMFDEPLWQARS